MMENIALVAVGGFFGAIARFGISKLIKHRIRTAFPIATLFVNLLGAFLLGMIYGANLGSAWVLLLGTGFMGAFTTFSTFKLESIQLHENRRVEVLVWYLAISYSFGILLAFLGMKAGMHL